MSAAITTCALAYNISDLLSDDYNLPKFYQKLSSDNSQYMTFWCLSREQILNLPFPKYIESKNSITTMYTSFQHLVHELDYYGIQIQSGETALVGHIFEPTTVKKVEIIEPLPDGFNFDPSGAITGSFELLNGETHKVFDSLIQITDLFDEIRNVKVRIGIVEDNFDVSQVEHNDPILSLDDKAVKFQLLTTIEPTKQDIPIVSNLD
jgi:hypothetical protein